MKPKTVLSYMVVGLGFLATTIAMNYTTSIEMMAISLFCFILGCTTAIWAMFVEESATVKLVVVKTKIDDGKTAYDQEKETRFK